MAKAHNTCWIEVLLEVAPDVIKVCHDDVTVILGQIYCVGCFVWLTGNNSSLSDTTDDVVLRGDVWPVRKGGYGVLVVIDFFQDFTLRPSTWRPVLITENVM